MSHNYLNKNRTQELINTIRGHLSDIATVLSNLASGDARDNTKAPINHTQPSSTITAMTGYTKPQSTSAIAATDTLNEAIGKLEKGLEDAGGGGETIPPIVINKVSNNVTTSDTPGGNKTIITFDPNLIGNHPIKFNIKACSIVLVSSSPTDYRSYDAQTIHVEMEKHGYRYEGNPLSSISSEIVFSDYGYNLKTNVLVGSVSQTYLQGMTDSSKPMILKEGSSSIGISNNKISFYVTYYVSGSGRRATVIESIEPIDFTAVTSITHGGVTVWERT